MTRARTRIERLARDVWPPSGCQPRFIDVQFVNREGEVVNTMRVELDGMRPGKLGGRIRTP